MLRRNESCFSFLCIRGKANDLICSGDFSAIPNRLRPTGKSFEESSNMEYHTSFFNKRASASIDQVKREVESSWTGRPKLLIDSKVELSSQLKCSAVVDFESINLNIGAPRSITCRSQSDLTPNGFSLSHPSTTVPISTWSCTTASFPFPYSKKSPFILKATASISDWRNTWQIGSQIMHNQSTDHFILSQKTGPTSKINIYSKQTNKKFRCTEKMVVPSHQMQASLPLPRLMTFEAFSICAQVYWNRGLDTTFIKMSYFSSRYSKFVVQIGAVTIYKYREC